MLWKINNKLMKSPSTYKDDIEDSDHDSYTSATTGELFDNPVAVGMLKLEMTWDDLTEEETEEIIQATYQNPMMITVKCPSVRGGMITAPFRVSKRSTEMHETGQDENTSKSRWKVSINFMQKKLVSAQKQAVEEANS